MFTFRKSRQRGSAIAGLMLIAFIAAIALVISQVTEQQTKTTRDKVKGTRFSVLLDSSIQTMVMAYRLAEINYNVALGGCTSGSAAPFLEALKSGHGCAAGVGAVNVFGNADALGMQTANMYSYVNPGGCTIGLATGLRCGGAAPPFAVITIGTSAAAAQQRIDSYMMQFTLNTVLPAKEIVEFAVQVTDPKDNKFIRRVFAIRGSLTNAAHLEVDGRVTQELPDPLSRCPGGPWKTFSVYNSDARACQDFGKLGSGTGLAYYQGRFFGFRPADGQVVDLLAAGAAALAGYLVDPTTGATCAACPRIFPSYDMNSLTNADDITLINDQIYFIARSAAEAHIGVVTTDGAAVPKTPSVPPDIAGAPTRVPLCPLGALGWGQAYIGLASLDWSDPLLPEVGDPDRMRMATFLAKTDGGSMLTVTVRSAKGAPPAGDPGCMQFKLRGADYWSCCNVFKDDNIQQIEYTRTLGFDRTDTVKPYYVY